MKPLIPLSLAKGNLKVLNSDDDDNISALLQQASALVVDYLKIPVDTYETGTVPLLVQAATMAVLRALYDTPEKDPITEAVESILRRSRDPALA